MKLILQIGNIEVIRIEGKQPKCRPCGTCRYKFLFADTKSAGCLMFGNHQLPTARDKYCGKLGDAWEPLDAEQSSESENFKPESPEPERLEQPTIYEAVMERR